MESPPCRPQPGAALPRLDPEARSPKLSEDPVPLSLAEGRWGPGLLGPDDRGKKRGYPSLRALCWPRGSERGAGVFIHRRVRTPPLRRGACKMQIPGRL